MFIELRNEVHVSMFQPLTSQSTLILHGGKAFVMTVLFFNINCKKILISMAHENIFII